LNSEIPQGSIVLVTGAEGTLKSRIVFKLVSSALTSSGEHGLYITLDQSKESHLENMKSLGLERSKSLHVFDYHDVRREWKDRELDMVRTTVEIIDFYKEKYNNLTFFALDCLESLYSLSEKANIRKSMYQFFSKLRDDGLTSFLIMEAPRSEVLVNRRRPEHFLADGVIELGIIEGKGGIKRYIQIPKMRATKHALDKHQLMVDKDGLHVLGSIY
jgi:KaiC/GvpD/RAD55 family RecA-like ATPase